MSTLEADPEVGEREPEVDIRPMGSVVTRARIAQVGALSVRRLLPLRDRRTVGAWCFIDHYGPMSVDAGPGMHVPPHPHIGLQTASPARAYSEIVGVDINVRRDRDDELPLSPGFEYALLATLGSANVDGALLEPGKMLYVSPGREAVRVRSATGSRLLLLGGKPFAEKIMMWWNFVARSAAEIADAADAWNDRRRFGGVDADRGERLAAPVPELTRLRLR